MPGLLRVEHRAEGAGDEVRAQVGLAAGAGARVGALDDGAVRGEPAEAHERAIARGDGQAGDAPGEDEARDVRVRALPDAEAFGLQAPPAALAVTPALELEAHLHARARPRAAASTRRTRRSARPVAGCGRRSAAWRRASGARRRRRAPGRRRAGQQRGRDDEGASHACIGQWRTTQVAGWTAAYAAASRSKLTQFGGRGVGAVDDVAVGEREMPGPSTPRDVLLERLAGLVESVAVQLDRQAVLLPVTVNLVAAQRRCSSAAAAGRGL